MLNIEANKRRLVEEFDNLRKRLLEIEARVEETLGDAADEAVRRMRQLVSPEPVVDVKREELIRALAELKSRNRGDGQAISHWLEAEEEIGLVLDRLALRK